MASFPPLTAAYQLPISFVFSMSCVALALLFVVAVYNDPRRNSCAATLLVLLGLVCALGFAALFPTDVSLALADARYGIVNASHADGAEADDGDDEITEADAALKPMLTALYVATYWTGLVMSCGILPSMDLIIGSGAFGFCARFFDALFSIVKMVIGGLVLVGVVTGVAIWANWIDEDDDASFFGYVEVTCIALSNSVGFVKITLLLSYGLVELPRAVWRSSKWADDGNLNRHRLQVARESP